MQKTFICIKIKNVLFTSLNVDRCFRCVQVFVFKQDHLSLVSMRSISGLTFMFVLLCESSTVVMKYYR